MQCRQAQSLELLVQQQQQQQSIWQARWQWTPREVCLPCHAASVRTLYPTPANVLTGILCA